MSDDVKLSPCPFQPSEGFAHGLMVTGERAYPYVKCSTCSARGPVETTPMAAIEAWNRRAPSPAPAPTWEEARERAAREVEEREMTARTVAKDYDAAGDAGRREQWLCTARYLAKVASAIRSMQPAPTPVVEPALAPPPPPRTALDEESARLAKEWAAGDAPLRETDVRAKCDPMATLRALVDAFDEGERRLRAKWGTPEGGAVYAEARGLMINPVAEARACISDATLARPAHAETDASRIACQTADANTMTANAPAEPAVGSVRAERGDLTHDRTVRLTYQERVSIDFVLAERGWSASHIAGRINEAIGSASEAARAERDAEHAEQIEVYARAALREAQQGQERAAEIDRLRADLAAARAESARLAPLVELGRAAMLSLDADERETKARAHENSPPIIERGMADWQAARRELAAAQSAANIASDAMLDAYRRLSRAALTPQPASASTKGEHG